MRAAAASDHDHAIIYPEEPLYGRASAGKLGMWVFLLSDGFSFGGLLLGYALLRAKSEVWGCVDEAISLRLGCTLEPKLGVNFTAVLTFVLICSSLTMVMAHAAAVEGDRRATMRWLGLTIGGGLLFLLGQMYEYWGLFGLFGPHHGLVSEGLVFGASHYATTFYVITGFHGLHVTAGVIYLVAILVGTAMKKTDANTIEVAGLFWHYVDLVWILVFTFVYLIPHG